jgi:arylsulfatase A-like enzyme
VTEIMDWEKIFRLTAAGIAILIIISVGDAWAEYRKPNIILIVADDLGYCDSDLYGCDRIPTPNIDMIAQMGVLFTAGYVTNPVCAPSRAALMTGRYQQRFGFEYNTGPLSRDYDQGLGLPLEEITVADVLKNSGYVTGMVGKWHLGTQPKFHPLKRGFDEFFGFTFGASLYINPNRKDVISYFKNGRTQLPDWKGRDARNPIMRGTVAIKEESYLTDAFTREGLSFIERHHQEPFFLYLAYSAPHTPLQATLKYYARFEHIKDERQRIYAAMVSALDDGVGQILSKLSQYGLAANTLIIFLSDNGCALYTKACSNDPLRLGKLSQFEGGVRVPFAMMWPDQIAPRAKYDDPVSALDIMPTVLAAANAKMIQERVLDGVDLLPYLNGEIDSPPHKILFWRDGPNWAVRDGNWKLFAAEGHYWLFDLAVDIGEKTNLADLNMEVCQRLKNEHDQWNAKMMPPLWGPRGSIPFELDGVNLKWHY